MKVKEMCENCRVYCNDSSSCLHRITRVDSADTCEDFEPSLHIYKDEVERLENIMGEVALALREDRHLCNWCKHQNKKVNETPCCNCYFDQREGSFEFKEVEYV